MNRREFLRGTIGTGVSLLFAIACGDQRPILTPAYTPSAGTSDIGVPSPEVVNWYSLPASERIQRLETKQYPEIKNFSPIRELIVASAQFFHEKLRPEITTQEITDSVRIVESDTLLSEYEKANRTKLYPKDREAVKRFADLEVNREKRRVIFINNQTIKEVAEIAKDARPDIEEAMGNRDLTTVLTKDALFRAFLLMNRSSEKIPLSPFPIKMNNAKANNTFYVQGIDQLKLSIRNSRGGFITSQGALRSMVEYLTRWLSKESGEYFPYDVPNLDGASLIEATNQIAGVNVETTADVFMGRNTIRALFEEWGKSSGSVLPPQEAGQAIYSIIEFTGNSLFNSIQEAGAKMDEVLNTPLSSNSA